MKTRHKLSSERKQEIVGAIVLCAAVLLFLALFTNGLESYDPTGRYIETLGHRDNLFGRPGAILAAVLGLGFGEASHVLYVVIFVWGLMLLSHRPLDRLLTRFVGLFLVTTAVAGLLHVDFSVASRQPGGAIGAFAADKLFVPYFGVLAANVIAITLAAIGILLSTDFLFVHVLSFAHRGLVHLISGALAIWDGGTLLLRRHRNASAARALRYENWKKLAFETNGKSTKGKVFEGPFELPEAEAVEAEKREPIRIRDAGGPQKSEEQAELFSPEAAAEAATLPATAVEHEQLEIAAPVEPVQVERPPAKPLEVKPATRTRPRRKAAPVEELPPDFQYPKRYTKPSIDMLDQPEKRVIPNLEEMLRETSRRLEETLLTFSIEARVTDVTRGPTITRFELEPAPGIKVSRFLALADDIALALKAQRVRVEAPIPGKGRVGIEIPNSEREQVLIRELLESRIFQRGKGRLNLALGKDIAGEVMIADLASMPHLLVAGATGAGKTVCVKALLASLLFSHTPDDLQLMLIDPKMVELSVFNDIPHLITPVVTDPKKASSALNWLITEMEERYRLFADLRVRNIEIYNQSVENGEIEVPQEEEGDTDSYSVIRRLPYIVCIIDELADLMMLARSEVEDSIGRLAQLARAVGIHLIIATQRPSVDVLTGVIKANFPSRISFQVSSRVDSRCILDEIGAERLIGMGDMLYLPPGQSKPYRIQGAFVSDDEMNGLVAYLKTQAPPQYRDEIENFGKTKESLAELADETDPLFDEAVQVVFDTGQASISMVQRRLRVGYTRAARLIDMMELKGIVGPHTGSKAREILIDAPAKDEVA